MHPPGGGLCWGGGGGTHNSQNHFKRGDGKPSLGFLLLDIRLSVARLFSNPFPAWRGQYNHLHCINCPLFGLLVISPFFVRDGFFKFVLFRK